jgi:hypothetical protein
MYEVCISWLGWFCGGCVARVAAEIEGTLELYFFEIGLMYPLIYDKTISYQLINLRPIGDR